MADMPPAKRRSLLDKMRAHGAIIDPSLERRIKVVEANQDVFGDDPTEGAWCYRPDPRWGQDAGGPLHPAQYGSLSDENLAEVLTVLEAMKGTVQARWRPDIKGRPRVFKPRRR